jgi:hypothetical protein
MRREVKSTQREMRLMELFVDGTGTAALSGPAQNQATLTDNGTGDYTITFDEPFGQVPIVVATPKTANILCQVVTNTISAVNIKTLGAAVGAGTASVPTIPYQNSYITHEGLTLFANFAGAAGATMSYAKTTGATAGSEVVSVVNTAGAYAISVQVEDGVSTAAQVAAAISADAVASNIVAARAVTPATAQGALTDTPFTGGVDGVLGSASVGGALSFADTDADFHLLVISSEIAENY